MEPSFPLAVPPACRDCGKPCKLYHARSTGRPYYACRRWDESDYHPKSVFACFDDSTGVSSANPPCYCEYSSRRTKRNNGDSHFFSCPIGKCSYIVSDDTTESSADESDSKYTTMSLSTALRTTASPEPGWLFGRPQSNTSQPSRAFTLVSSPLITASSTQSGAFAADDVFRAPAPASTVQGSIVPAPTAPPSGPTTDMPSRFGATATVFGSPADEYATQSSIPAGGLSGSAPVVSTSPSTTPQLQPTFVFSSPTTAPTSQSNIITSGLSGLSLPESANKCTIPPTTASPPQPAAMVGFTLPATATGSRSECAAASLPKSPQTSIVPLDNSGDLGDTCEPMKLVVQPRRSVCESKFDEKMTRSRRSPLCCCMM
ncbi:uncharacterized protein F5Z01DRAFT_750436 [Emericellopsis atlantica]|uniref:Uncharacterized protein n=1 Tax=Emericellopsis atlantica TaxID=2614577 RepID=A0A9P7ZL68_9HYPO|nr:uncharacterized protein F5Z01DRAFT_750436 [Emericellopsis atlantica]KAG9253976.1 hypothetical protein F5Z01DRAFT_750436 [Emericellopsis atlantica]